jgi:hypothetical protein
MVCLTVAAVCVVTIPYAPPPPVFLNLIFTQCPIPGCRHFFHSGGWENFFFEPFFFGRISNADRAAEPSLE